MATKAAKSITINATKYELANSLATNDGKIQLLAKDVVLGEVELPSGGGGDALFFYRDTINGIVKIVEVKNSKGETISDTADAYAIIEKGGMVYLVYDGIYEPMTYVNGDASGFTVVFARQNSGSITPHETVVGWGEDESTPFLSEIEYRGDFSLSRVDLTSLSELVVGDGVFYHGYNYPLTDLELASITLVVWVNENAISCQCISKTENEYGEGTYGMTFLASYNSEKYLIGLKYPHNVWNNYERVWTIGSLKDLSVSAELPSVGGDFFIDLTDGQEMFNFTQAEWTCTSFEVDDLKAAIADGKRIVIRAKNYPWGDDNQTPDKMYFVCSHAIDSNTGSQVMLAFTDGSRRYNALVAYTGTISSLNVHCALIQVDTSWV